MGSLGVGFCGILSFIMLVFYIMLGSYITLGPYIGVGGAPRGLLSLRRSCWAGSASAAAYVSLLLFVRPPPPVFCWVQSHFVWFCWLESH